jgi:hypothetical protein
MPKLMKIGQRRRHMEQRAVLGQRRHARDEVELEGKKEAAVVPGKFARAVAVDFDATPLRLAKNKPVVDVLAATIAENTAEVGMTADEMAAAVAAAVAAAAGLHIE